MARFLTTLGGLLIVGLAAIFIGRNFVRSSVSEGRTEPVLPGHYAPRLDRCAILEDAELPESVRAPQVDEDLLYIEVVLLYPGVPKAPAPEEHQLTGVNGDPRQTLAPVWHGQEPEEEDVLLTLVFQATGDFQHAALQRGEEVLFERLMVDEGEDEDLPDDAGED